LNYNNNNIVLNVDDKKPVQRELKICNKHKDLDLEKSKLFEKENYENNLKLEDNKNDEIIDKKNSNIRHSVEDIKQIVNIGIFGLKLGSIKKNEKNQSKKDNIKSSVNKIDYNYLKTHYYDISIILSLICIKKKEYKIEFVIKDVSKYYKNYEKLKNILNSNCLNISKLIHEFKTPLNCIIGLANESQLLMDSSKSNFIKNFDLLKDDIETINGLSNYTVFLIKDLTDYLKKFNENKKLNENDDINNIDDDEFLEENKNKRTSRDLKNDSEEKININFNQAPKNYLNKGFSQKSEKQKNLEKKLINLDYYSLIDILNFSYSILTSLIKCSKIKSKSIYPKLSISEEIKNFIIYTDEIKLKQILLNLISNSVKFTYSGYIEIEAKYIDDFSKKYVEINVKDTGIGINENEKHKIFQDYSNIHHDKSLKNNNTWGTGLGLSFSRQIASLLDIDLTYDFIYKNGSKFNIDGKNLTNKIPSNNSNDLTSIDINNNSLLIDPFVNQETKVFMSGIRIIDRNNLSSGKSNIVKYSSERIEKKNPSEEKIFNYNSLDLDQIQNFTNNINNTSNLYDRIMKRLQTHKYTDNKISLLSINFNKDKANIHNDSGILEKEEETKKINSNNSHCFNSSTPRTKQSNMTSFLRINFSYTIRD